MTGCNDYRFMPPCLRTISDTKKDCLDLTAQLNLTEFLNLPWFIQLVDSDISQFIRNSDYAEKKTMIDGRIISLKDEDLGAVFCLQSGRLQMKRRHDGQYKSRSFSNKARCRDGFSISGAASIKYRTWFQFLQTTFCIKPVDRPISRRFAEWVEKEASDIIGPHDTQTVFANNFWDELRRLKFQDARECTLIGAHIAIILQKSVVAKEEASSKTDNDAKVRFGSTSDVQREPVTPPQWKRSIGINREAGANTEYEKSAKDFEQAAKRFHSNESSMLDAQTVHERIRNLERDEWMEERKALQSSVSRVQEENSRLQREKDRVVVTAKKLKEDRDYYIALVKNTDRAYVKILRSCCRVCGTRIGN